MKSVKRIVVFALVLILLSCMAVFAADDQENVPEIYIDSVNTIAGQTVKLNLGIKNNPGITNLRLHITYDDKNLSLLGVNDTELLSGGVFSDTVKSDSPIVLYWDNSKADSDITVNGVIATLTFKVESNTTAYSYPVTVSADLSNHDILNFSGETVNFEMKSGLISTFDLMIGDLNQDSKVDVLDCQMLLRNIAGWSDYQSIELATADLNDDGEVGLEDGIVMLRHIAKWSGYNKLPYKMINEDEKIYTGFLFMNGVMGNDGKYLNGYVHDLITDSYFMLLYEEGSIFEDGKYEYTLNKDGKIDWYRYIEPDITGITNETTLSLGNSTLRIGNNVYDVADEFTIDVGDYSEHYKCTIEEAQAFVKKTLVDGNTGFAYVDTNAAGKLETLHIYEYHSTTVYDYYLEDGTVILNSKNVQSDKYVVARVSGTAGLETFLNSNKSYTSIEIISQEGSTLHVNASQLQGLGIQHLTIEGNVVFTIESGSTLKLRRLDVESGATVENNGNVVLENGLYMRDGSFASDDGKVGTSQTTTFNNNSGGSISSDFLDIYGPESKFVQNAGAIANFYDVILDEESSLFINTNTYDHEVQSAGFYSDRGISLSRLYAWQQYPAVYFAADVNHETLEIRKSDFQIYVSDEVALSEALADNSVDEIILDGNIELSANLEITKPITLKAALVIPNGVTCTFTNNAELHISTLDGVLIVDGVLVNNGEIKTFCGNILGNGEITNNGSLSAHLNFDYANLNQVDLHLVQCSVTQNAPEIEIVPVVYTGDELIAALEDPNEYTRIDVEDDITISEYDGKIYKDIDFYGNVTIEENASLEIKSNVSLMDLGDRTHNMIVNGNISINGGNLDICGNCVLNTKQQIELKDGLLKVSGILDQRCDVLNNANIVVYGTYTIRETLINKGVINVLGDGMINVNKTATLDTKDGTLEGRVNEYGNVIRNAE